MSRHTPNRPRRSSSKVSILPADIEQSSRSFQLDDTPTVCHDGTNDDPEGDGRDYADAAGVSRAAAAASAFAVTSLTGSGGVNSRKSKRSISSSLRRSFDDSTQFVVDLSSDNRNTLKDNKFVQELTINKLNFKSLHVIGREDAVQTLQSCVDRSVCSDHDGIGIDDTSNHSSKRATAFGDVVEEEEKKKKKEVVFIRGYSGIGKTALALEGAEEYVSKKYENAIVGKGKYSIHNHDEPYSGIAAAFEEICNNIVQQRQQKQKHRNPQDDSDRTSMIGANILKHVGQDGAMILSRLIPSLDLVISPLDCSNRSINSSSNGSSDKRDHDADLERLKYGFRVLVREICSSFSPVVIILDDLQWSDRRSMDVVTYLLSDTENCHGGLTIIGLYRSEEVDDNHPLQERINGWTELPDLCNVTNIQLDGLSAHDVNQIIMTLLSIDDEAKTRKLSDICFRRTFGNPFFLLKFIEMLEREDLLNYNLGSLKWMWDENTVEIVTMSTENVVSILQARMKKLPPECQKLIQLAACLGPTFHISPLQHVWLSHSSVTEKNRRENILPLLDLLNSEQFLEQCGVGSNHYRFVHDKVQEAALSLSNSRDSQFRAEIGWILFDSLGQEELERMLFDVVDLVNQGKIVRPRLVHASLNFRAAKKARSLSAFESASAYISRCIGLLPDDKWMNHRELTLGIYSLGIEMEVALGRDHIMDELVEEVTAQKSLSCLDKIPIYFAKTHKLCNIDLDYAGTIDLSLEVLKDLGCPLPANPVTLPPIALWSFFRIVKRAKNTPKSVFESPKVMVEQKYRSAMLFLSRIFYASYFLKRQYLLVISASEMARITLDFGVSKFAGQSFSSLGLIVNAVQGDTETSTYFAETALVIQKSLKSNYTESQTIFISHTYILGWTAPLSASLPHMAHGFNIGMQSGNVAYAFWCVQSLRCFSSYQIGKPLSQILTHLPGLVAQMEDLHQREISTITRMWWQLMLTLSGDSDELTLLKGRAYDQQRDGTGLPLHDVMINFLQSELCVFFGDYMTAADSALDQGDSFEKGMGSHVMVMIHTFHRGVALYAMARRTRKRKYMVAAERFRRTIARWAQRGNPNVNHYHLLLSAEAMALKRGRHYIAAGSFYKQAIVLAGRTGHLHDAALFNQRYSDFLRHQMNDEEEADLKMNEAMRWYSEWGASRVVERLESHSTS